MFPYRLNQSIYTLFVATTVIASWAASASGVSNIDPVNKLAWGENIGWTNWLDADGGIAGVAVSGTFMGGFIWGENVGWINVGDGTPAGGISYGNFIGADSGVNIDSDGTLHGFAWGENVGWVNFDGGSLAFPPLPATIECGGRLDGFVWGENVGWINLSEVMPGKFVSVDAATVPVDCDMNHNGIADGDDIQLFIDFLTMMATPDWRDVCSGDVEPIPDQVIDMDDVAEFVACLL